MDERIEEDNDSILRYLIEQQKYQPLQTEGFEPLELVENSQDIEYNIKLLVGNLIGTVENVIKSSEDYSDKLHAHNQYGLFNMNNIIKDFEIDNDLYDRLSFRETLLISRLDFYHDNMTLIGASEGHKQSSKRGDEKPQPMGGICIDVQKGNGSQPFKREEPMLDLKMMKDMDYGEGGQNVTEDQARLVPEDDLDTQRRRGMSKLLVHVSSDFDYYTKNGGSRITTWIDRNLHTLEELRREYLMIGKDTIEEKYLLTMLKPYKYHVQHKDLAAKFESRKLYMYSKTKEYISEGTNFVLMRYMAIKQFIGTFELSCMYINGDMCRNIYKCWGPKRGTINGQRIDIWKIHRTIIEECGITHKCATMLTLNGQIVKQEWKGCNFILHVNPLLKISNNTPPGNDQILLQDCWVDDMQLLSKYLDDKNKSQMKMHSYLVDHPEIKKMIGDYIQEMIMRKPSDIIEYTIDHFLYFAPDYLPRYDFK